VPAPATGIIAFMNVNIRKLWVTVETCDVRCAKYDVDVCDERKFFIDSRSWYSLMYDADVCDVG
jgi:hypothetical protein